MLSAAAPSGERRSDSSQERPAARASCSAWAMRASPCLFRSACSVSASSMRSNRSSTPSSAGLGLGSEERLRTRPPSRTALAILRSAFVCPPDLGSARRATVANPTGTPGSHSRDGPRFRRRLVVRAGGFDKPQRLLVELPALAEDPVALLCRQKLLVALHRVAHNPRGANLIARVRTHRVAVEGGLGKHGVVVDLKERGEPLHRLLGVAKELVEADDEDLLAIEGLGLDHLAGGALPELEQGLGIGLGVATLGRGEPAQRIAKDRDQAPVRVELEELLAPLAPGPARREGGHPALLGPAQVLVVEPGVEQRRHVGVEDLALGGDPRPALDLLQEDLPLEGRGEEEGIAAL